MHVVFICVERAKCREIRVARAPALLYKVRASTPGEIRPAVLYGDDIRNHASVASVPVGECMNSRNELVMKPNEAFIDGKDFIFHPILSVSEKLGYALSDLTRVAADVQFVPAVGPRPFPNVIKHFGME